MKIFALCFIGAGVILLAISGILFVRELVFLGRAETTSGIVTAYSTYTDSEDSTLYCPVIKYTTREGENNAYTSSSCSAPADFNIGDMVQMVYDPGNPKNVQIKNIWDEYVGTIITGLIGLPFFIVGVWLYLAKIRRA